VFGRHQAEALSVSGVYGGQYAHDDDWQKLRKDVEGFASRYGRRPRILVAKMGQDGHDRGA
jgi:methylmalonyl-CoA mutase